MADGAKQAAHRIIGGAIVRRRWVSLGAAAGALALACSAVAEEPKGEPGGAAPPPAAAAPDTRYQPGFIDALGRFIGDSADKLNSQLKDARDKLDGFHAQTTDQAKGAIDAAKDAADSLIRVRVATGHERCAAAPNGGADCVAAATAVCRSKGFASGRALDTQAQQKCPARVWLSGRMPGADECPSETFVIRAVCQ